MKKDLKNSQPRTALQALKVFCAGSSSMKVAHYLLILNVLFAEGQSLSDLRKAFSRAFVASANKSWVQPTHSTNKHFSKLSGEWSSFDRDVSFVEMDCLGCGGFIVCVQVFALYSSTFSSCIPYNGSVCVCVFVDFFPFWDFLPL